MFGDSIWSIVIIAGPIILAAAIVWAMMNNKTTKAQDARTEQATRDLYEEPQPGDNARKP